MEKKRTFTSKNNIYALLGMLYAAFQYIWTFFFSSYLKTRGTLSKITSPLGFLPIFIFNLILAIPMILVFLGTLFRYKRDFDDKMMYIKTERYTLTLILSTIYALMLPLATRVAENPRTGAFAWFYYLVFISFLEEFLYRGLVPYFVERSSFPSWVKSIFPAVIYGLYQSALPFAQHGFSVDTIIGILPNVIFSTLIHFALVIMKNWSGAMWLPIVVHAILELSAYLIF